MGFIGEELELILEESCMCMVLHGFRTCFALEMVLCRMNIIAPNIFVA